MKKLLVLAIVSMFSLSCMATHNPKISINNKSDKTVEVRDTDNNSIEVEPGRSASLTVRVHEPHGSFPIPSLLMPYKTTITVIDDEGENTIEIDENTKSITISEGLQLSKK